VISRATALEALASDHFDVVVIGGGVTGAGCALDAASRGYSVALVERGDFAQGTSSRSSKLVHGGLRYLQNFDLGLVREALLERQLMVQLAPHLVHPLRFVVPAFEGDRPDLLVGLGLNMYDAMSYDRRSSRRRRDGDDGGERRRSRSRLRRRRGAAPGPLQDDVEYEWSPDRHRLIEGEEVLELIPALAPRNPTSGYLFYDCQTDDVRLVLTILGEAERFGAVIANRLEVVDLLEPAGRAEGVAVRDTVSGEEFQVRADNVVNAAGVWVDRIRAEELYGEAEVPVISPSRGSHVLFNHEQLPLNAGAIVPAGEGRSIFAVPWLGSTLIGTTDNDYDGDIDHVRPSEDDVDYLIDAVNNFFATDFTPEDTAGAYAGVRPLVSSGDSRKSVDISRRAELYETSSGMITITGGKLTTWRRMAKMAIDRVVERDGREAACRTKEIPLGMAVDPDELPRVEGVPEESYTHLASRYGFAAHDVLRRAAERAELAQPIVEGRPDLLAEAVFAAENEQAGSVEDVFWRRTRLGLLAGRRLARSHERPIRRVATALAKELGWSDQRVEEEIAAYQAVVRAEVPAI
jgi:glycerol-3-phosphate dehydrogenase